MNNKYQHIPVLEDRVIKFLKPADNKVVVDATLGLGGHALSILKKCSNCQIIGIDQDKQALKLAQKNLAEYQNRITLKQGNFVHLDELVNKKVDGVIFDLGLSSMQLDKDNRGFSFRKKAKLDMRMNQNQTKAAQDVINNYSVDKLTEIIRNYGEERWAKKIALNINETRKEGKIKTTDQLARIIRSSIPKKFWPKKIDPSTRTFQAIRIEVNDELKNLEKGLDVAIRLLKKGGRVVVISFHSLEDRIVKNKFKDWAKDCVCPPDYPICKCDKEKQVKILTKKPIRASKKEIELNPRSRSAKLRACEKI